MNPQTWVTTGHVSSLSDPLLDCLACKARHRADKLIGEEHHEVNVDAMSFDEMDAFIACLLYTSTASTARSSAAACAGGPCASRCTTPTASSTR